MTLFLFFFCDSLPSRHRQHQQRMAHGAARVCFNSENRTQGAKGHCLRRVVMHDGSSGNVTRGSPRSPFRQIGGLTQPFSIALERRHLCTARGESGKVLLHVRC
jgi:hypothetical protein